MLNATRSLPTMLAFRYASFRSAGDSQSAWAATTYHAFSGCSARDSVSQKVRNVRFAMIRMTSS